MVPTAYVHLQYTTQSVCPSIPVGARGGRDPITIQLRHQCGKKKNVLRPGELLRHAYLRTIQISAVLLAAGSSSISPRHHVRGATERSECDSRTN